jgi:excisionase family DNA binding protein
VPNPKQKPETAKTSGGATKAPVERMAYGAEEFAKSVGCGKSHIYDLIAEGKIRTIKIGNRRLIPAQEARRVVAEGA